MELSSFSILRNLLYFLIFQETKTPQKFFIFQETEALRKIIIFQKMFNPKFKKIKKIRPEKKILYFRKLNFFAYL